MIDRSDRWLIGKQSAEVLLARFVSNVVFVTVALFSMPPTQGSRRMFECRARPYSDGASLRCGRQAMVAAVTTRPDVRRRHRERRLQTRQRILDVTRELLEDRPWSDVSIDEITRRAELTRTAFYRHFPNRRALLLALLDELGVRLDLVADPWERGEGDRTEQLQRALHELVDLFHRHGRLLRAIADVAANDGEVATTYADLGARLSASAAARIALDVAEGRSAVADPAEVAAALVWMNERYLLERFGRPPLADPERTAAALGEVWERTIYGGRR